MLDYVWPITLTIVLEPSIAITAICLAQMRPLFKKIIPKSWSSSKGTKESSAPALVTFGQGGRSYASNESRVTDEEKDPYHFELKEQKV